MADDGLTGQAWLNNYTSGGGSRLSSDFTSPSIDARRDYNPNFGAESYTSIGLKYQPSDYNGYSPSSGSHRLNGSTSGDPYAYNPETGFGYGRPSSSFSNVFSRGPTKSVGPAYPGPKLGYNASAADVQAIRDWQTENRAPYVPSSDAFSGARNRYPAFTKEQNKAAVSRINELEGRNAILGRLGAGAFGKELGGRVLNDVPGLGLVFRKLDPFGVEGRGLTGLTKAGRAARIAADIGTMGMLGGPLISLTAGALTDAASDYFSPPEPLYKGGYTGREDLTRMKLVNGVPTPKGIWEK